MTDHEKIKRAIICDMIRTNNLRPEKDSHGIKIWCSLAGFILGVIWTILIFKIYFG
jgi:heme/copper-type cytochrome/quinol oxidase subunit 4